MPTLENIRFYDTVSIYPSLICIKSTDIFRLLPEIRLLHCALHCAFTISAITLYSESQNLYSMRRLYKLTLFSRKNGQETTRRRQKSFLLFIPRNFGAADIFGKMLARFGKCWRVRISASGLQFAGQERKRIGFARSFERGKKKKGRFDERN